MALAARQAGYRAIIVPFDNSREASVVTDIDVLPNKKAQIFGFDNLSVIMGPKKFSAIFDADYSYASQNRSRLKSKLKSSRVLIKQFH
jgi:hypothetical protein